MILREATMQDAELLFSWRNDHLTRMQSIQQDEVPWHGHLAWLEKSLQSESRKIYIAESEGIPVGTVRFDFGETCVEMSWTLAPEQRGRGLGSLLLKTGVQLIHGSQVIARIKSSNVASIRIAEKVGFVRIRQEGDVLLFSKNV